MSEFKGQKRLPGYLTLFLQEQAKEFYSCTKPITSGWIRSKHCSAQIVRLTPIWFLCFGQWPWWKIGCQMDHHGYLEEIYMLLFTLDCTFLSSTLLYLLTWQHSVFPKWSMLFLKRRTDGQHNREGWWWSQLPQDCPIYFCASWHREVKIVAWLTNLWFKRVLFKCYRTKAC